MKKIFIFACSALLLASCGGKQKPKTQDTPKDTTQKMSTEDALLGKYTTVRLEADLSTLTENERKMIPLLIDAAMIMDDLFWDQALGEPKDEFLAKIKNEKLKQFAIYNYGPWDRLDDNKPFIEGYGEKPKGANFYPTDMDTTEFKNWKNSEKAGLYSVIRRDSKGKLILANYNEYYKKQLDSAAVLIKMAAQFADEPGLNKYLHLRSEALSSNNYQPSDIAWMEMKNNRIDFVVGPIETYEDALYGYRTSFEAYVLIKDMEWSKKLQKYAAMLPELQAGLPVDAKYKSENPGSNSDLNAYEVVYYAGHGNSGGKTIAINLPNDEDVQLKYGSRRLQLKNVMKAKFDQILMPIAKEIMDPGQLAYVNFDAFFSNVMFHEVAHGLGIKKTIDGKKFVREALLKHASALEEGKADILGLYMITELLKKGEIEGKQEEFYVTFMVSIVRSVRFGAADSHGKANMICFNHFLEQGAFTRSEDGKYKVNFDKMKAAMTSLTALILTIQGDGDYNKADKLINEKGVIGANLQADIKRINEKNIPIDIVFDQGKEVLGLK